MNKWMKLAYDEAVDGMLSNDGGPFGAVIIKDGKLIASAHNGVLKSNDPTAHAEINAIREASNKLGNFDLSGCVLYTTCYPCPMCLGAIFWARISTVYYSATQDDASRGGFDDKLFYEMLNNDDKSINISQIEHKKGTELFDMWLKKDNRKVY